MKQTLSLHDAYLFGNAINTLNQVQARLSAKVVLAMARNHKRVNDAFPNVDAEHSRIFRELGEPKENEPKFKEFVEAKLRYTKDTKIEVEIEQVSFSKLNIGEGDKMNPFPPSLVTALAPMLEDFETA